MILRAPARLAFASLALAALINQHIDQGLKPVVVRTSRAARRKGRFTTLTGAWSGLYRYPHPALPANPFNALIEENAGALSGSTMEPDMFMLGSIVTATLAGTRHDLDVSFTKQMDGSGGMTHAISYVGVADADLMRIDGTWLIPGEWSGTFTMERDGAGVEEAVARSVSAGDKD